MARRDRGAYDPASHALLFGSSTEHDAAQDEPAESTEPYRPSPRAQSRVAERQAARSNRHRRVVAGSVLAIVVVLAAAAYFIGVPVYRYFNPSDYSGSGSGSVVVTVHPNDDAGKIGTELARAGVVASDKAFTNAAKDDSRAQSIQPGSYRLHRKMSSTSALALLVNPSSRVSSDTVVPEGANVFRVEQLLTRPRCNGSTPSTSGCGLGATSAQVTAALKNIGNLGIPTDYLPAKDKQPSTVEGFLYPATYSFDDDTTVSQALQQMVGKFTDVVRTNRFSAAAQAVGLQPYQAVVLASMVQAEAKFPEDMPKVARVILNRLAAKTPLKIDATSVYAAEVAGVDPKTTNYATFKSPYNTYLNAGLPPTPVSNPGVDALKAAVSPAAGPWTYYVNGSADGHLYFTASAEDFVKAQQRCHVNGWGCAAP